MKMGIEGEKKRNKSVCVCVWGGIQVEQGWGWGLSFKYSPQENFRGTVGERVERTIVGWAEDCGKQPHRHWLREAV